MPTASPAHDLQLLAVLLLLLSLFEPRLILLLLSGGAPRAALANFCASSLIFPLVSLQTMPSHAMPA